MTAPQPSVRVPQPAGQGTVALICGPDSFLFNPGHRLRAARCLVCGDLIGGQPATIIGAIPLDGEICTCSRIDSDMWLIHASHMPMTVSEIREAVESGLRCDEAD